LEQARYSDSGVPSDSRETFLRPLGCRIRIFLLGRSGDSCGSLGVCTSFFVFWELKPLFKNSNYEVSTSGIERATATLRHILSILPKEDNIVTFDAAMKNIL